MKKDSDFRDPLSIGLSIVGLTIGCFYSVIDQGNLKRTKNQQMEFGRSLPVSVHNFKSFEHYRVNNGVGHDLDL